MIIQPMVTTFQIQGMAPLPHLGVIRVEGEEAAKFLHGQLTQDFSLLGLSEARLAAFCSAKGRMQASFVGFKRSHQEVLLVCSRDLLAPTLKRLSMFVLRAKARLSDASADFVLTGLAGAAVDMVAGQRLAPWAQLAREPAHLIGLYPAEGSARALWLAPTGTPLPDVPPLATDVWLWSEVRSGVATLSAALVEQLVPQMINYESVGGVNFKKGCYPGQEVVARSQFRGTLKRRGYLVHSAMPMAAGQEVFDVSDPSQPCGVVVQSALCPDGGYDAIASLQTAATASTLQLGQPGGPTVNLLPLPYPLLDDI